MEATAETAAILNVDDDEGHRQTLTRILQTAGFAVDEAATGAQALEKAAEGGFDLVVLDLKLPDLDGHEVSRRLRADPRTAALGVVHLGLAGEIAGEIGGEIGGEMVTSAADAYLAQPIEPGELLATVRSLLRVRRAEEAARAAAWKWEATFDAIADAVFVVGNDGNILRCNRAMGVLCGAEARELCGKPLEQAVHGALAGVDFPAPASLVRGERWVFDAQVGARAFRISLDPMIGANGVSFGGVGIVSDVSDTRRLEDELWRRYVQLVDIDRRKDEFLAMLGHELRNPLAAARAALDLAELDEGTGTVPGDRLRGTLHRQLGQLTRLVNDLLDVSRITRGRIRLERQHVDLREVLRNTVTAAEPRLTARGHRLVIQVADVPLPTYVDPTRIEQVIANLIDNAIKYSEPGPIEISLRAEVEGETTVAALSVRDYGIGIAHENLPRIFDLFVQLEPSLARTAGGLGIGLTLVQRLVAMHGGSVHVSSAGQGLGAEFVVRLPLTIEVAPAAGEPSPSPLRETQPELDRRVLLVEDNEDLREMVRYVIERHGWIVIEAPAGPEAIEIAAREHPPVALVDIGLPGIDGFEVARRIRASESPNDPKRPRMRLIAMTGYGSREDRERAIQAGFDAHLVKPVDADDLVRAIGGREKDRAPAA